MTLQRIAITIIVLIAIVCAQTSRPILAIQDPQGEEVLLSDDSPINVVITQDITSKTEIRTML